MGGGIYLKGIPNSSLYKDQHSSVYSVPWRPLCHIRAAYSLLVSVGKLSSYIICEAWIPEGSGQKDTRTVTGIFPKLQSRAASRPWSRLQCRAISYSSLCLCTWHELNIKTCSSLWRATRTNSSSAYHPGKMVRALWADNCCVIVQCSRLPVQEVSE